MRLEQALWSSAYIVASVITGCFAISLQSSWVRRALPWSYGSFWSCNPWIYSSIITFIASAWTILQILQSILPSIWSLVYLPRGYPPKPLHPWQIICVTRWMLCCGINPTERTWINKQGQVKILKIRWWMDVIIRHPVIIKSQSRRDKKIVAFVLLLCMALTPVACGKWRLPCRKICVGYFGRGYLRQNYWVCKRKRRPYYQVFYTDAACTESCNPYADTDSDLTIYVKWTYIGVCEKIS